MEQDTEVLWSIKLEALKLIRLLILNSPHRCDAVVGLGRILRPERRLARTVAAATLGMLDIGHVGGTPPAIVEHSDDAEHEKKDDEDCDPNPYARRVGKPGIVTVVTDGGLGDPAICPDSW